jgi:hypothetical protein
MHGTVCKSVYCHYDGYLDYTGRILQAHYDSTAANQLIAHGDNSGVKETIEAMNFYENGGVEGEDVQEFVNSTPWQVAHTFEEFLEQVECCHGEWYYVMKDGVWYVGNMYDRDQRFYKQLVPLAAAVAELKQKTVA